MTESHDLFDLEGRTVLVAGAGGVLGQAVAAAMASAEAKLAVADGDAGKLAALEASLGGQASLAVHSALTDALEVEMLVERVMYKFGRLDVLFCATDVQQRPDSIYELEPSEWTRVLRENLETAFLCAREAAKAMVEQGGGGKIVLLTSARVGHAVHSRPAAAYAAAKAGVAALVQQLAIELAPFVTTVNGLAAGPVNGAWGLPAALSPLLLEKVKAEIPLGRLAEPAELYGAAVFLASRASDYMTGQVLTVDGGWSL